MITKLEHWDNLQGLQGCNLRLPDHFPVEVISVSSDGTIMVLYRNLRGELVQLDLADNAGSQKHRLKTMGARIRLQVIRE